MIDLDELIAEARRWANGHPNRRSGELMRDLADALESVRAERDAALAAIDRVRVLHRRLNIVDEVTDERLGDACEVCSEIESYELTWPCPTVAALDWAPEPEEKP